MLSVAWPGKHFAQRRDMRIAIVVLALLTSNVAFASPRVALVEQPGDDVGEPLVLIPPGAAPVLQRAPTPPKQFALAVNNPIAWAGLAYAASGYVALTEHQAVRMNLAWFRSTGINPGVFVLGSIIAGEPIEDEAYREGGFFDVGAGWMYFPRRVWSGPTIELGAVLRTRHTYVSDEFSSPEDETFDTTTVAGRGLLGWSWDIRGRAFLAIAAGASYGYETGTRETRSSYDSPTVGGGVGRWTPGFEWYSRVGATF